MPDKTLREYIDIINEAQDEDIIEDTLDEDEQTVEEQFVSKAVPADNRPKPKHARAKVEQLVRNA
jgi:hypothetical protein